jgi:SWIB/MDM2 domain
MIGRTEDISFRLGPVRPLELDQNALGQEAVSSLAAIVATARPHKCPREVTTEFDNGRIKDRQRWNNGNQEAEGGPGKAAAALSRTLRHCRLVSAARTEVVSKVWEYIKANNLQNPENKREILADDKLQAVFGGKSKVSMFEMNKYFAQHLS